MNFLALKSAEIREETAIFAAKTWAHEIAPIVVETLGD
jgi:hypothetical protein